MKLLSLLFLLFCLKTSAQTLPNFVVPTGYTKVIEATGDLDKDGINEVVLAYNTDKKTVQIGFNNKEIGSERILYICKKINGSLKLWKKNSTVLWSSDECGFCTDNGVDLSLKIKNGTIVIEQTFWHNTRHTSVWKNIFRYQNADWFLIGSTYYDSYNCGYQHTYDINFSTKQVQIKYDNEDCEDGETHQPMTKKAFKYPFKSLLKMDGFTAGRKELKIPNSNQYFYY